jgi:glycosyltransferase involved in cell wall biosynthesis
MVEAPAVSIVIPAYNRGERLVRTVVSALAQDFAGFEIVIVDDASASDPVPALGTLVADPRIRVIRHRTNRGASAARNTGIEAARGRFVAFLDSDDEWDPAKLAVQYRAAMARPDPDRVFCVTQSTLLRSGRRDEIRPGRGAMPGEVFEEYLYVYGALTQTSSFFVSRALALANPFREELRQYEDHFFFIENCQAGADYVFVGRPLSIYHADHADGRLSCESDIRSCHAYLRVAGPCLSRRARYAFELRYLARMMAADQPVAAFGLFVRALVAGALRPRFAASFLLRLMRLRS